MRALLRVLELVTVPLQSDHLQRRCATSRPKGPGVGRRERFGPVLA